MKTIEELIDYILEGTQHRAKLVLKNWLANSVKYRTFIHKHKDKVRKKFRNSQTVEDLEDVLFELEIPYLFSLDDNFSIEYEKFGSKKNRRSPDFTIQKISGDEFNIEAKRIRETSISKQYEEVINQIIQPIRETPSSLGFSLDVVTFQDHKDFVTRLNDSAETVTKQILDLIQKEEPNMPPDKEIEFRIDKFPHELKVLLVRPSGKKNHKRTSYYGGICPIFYTNKEFQKLSDAIFEKLGQCIPTMINVLAITTNSSTHESEDVLEAINSINLLLRLRDDEFFKKKKLKGGAKEFLELTKALSCIVFKSTWMSSQKKSNLVWLNENADHEIAEDLIRYLEKMGHSSNCR